MRGVQKMFERFGKEAVGQLEDITKIKAMDIEADAKRNAVAAGVFNHGKLVQNIRNRQLKKLSYIVEAMMHYSAYMEFGTGDLVEVPDELKTIAIKFKGDGVKKVNISARPYMYPAFVKARQSYKKDLAKALNDLNKKYGYNG